MENTFEECTVCYTKLTPEEIEKNSELENHLYPICDDCLEKFTKRIINAMNK